ncbi:MAG TPA: HipA domain-containing protein, partial [Gammaproteobacteria bacterium]|nr:HipA domain-containing protein [Gammaproteobacteria bacterium]
GGLPGSSAHGEHPKFAVALQDADGTRHVLVKFSPRAETSVGQRWSDLLVAEHQAHEILRAADVPAAASRIFQIDGRTYLEMDRFDRHGPDGRLGVTSLFAIDASLYGELDDWIAAGTRLHRDRRIGDAELERIRLIATFGGLIANTDRHFGNLSFYDRYDGRFETAPVYDMLPMLFAPEHDQIVPRVFQPAEPTSDSLRAWPLARALAERYWRALANDSRISDDFREISSACVATLEALPRTGAYAYADAAR